MYCCLYIIIQLWIRTCCLAGCWKLSLNSQSYKDRVIEKLGLVSRWPDWLAVVMSQQGFCHWDTFLCDKNYMYDYITTGIIIRHVQNALPILIKKILTSILWMNLLVFTKQPYSEDKFPIIITNHEVRVMIWKVAHMTKRDLLLFC